jgi:thimet oligopeptidase
MRYGLLAVALGMLFPTACTKAPTLPPPAKPETPVVDNISTTQPTAAPALKPTPTKDEVYLEECRAQLAAAKVLIAEILADKAPRTQASLLVPYNQVSVYMGNAGSHAGLFSEVHPDETMRTSAEACVRDVSALATDLSLNRELYQAFEAVDTKVLDADTKRLVERTLRDFRRAGVDRDDATRKRLRELSDLEIEIGQKFDRNIREDRRSVKLDPAQLEGLPDDFIKAHAAGEGGKVTITTDYPDFLPFMSYADDGAARKALFMEFQNRGWPQNDEMFKRLLAVRKEKSTLLGFKSWADYITEDKMIKSATNAQDFIDKIAKAAEKRGKKDYAALLKRKQKDDKETTQVFDFEKAYYEEKVKKEDYGFDSQTVRPYFDFAQTQSGLLTITSKLFGVEYRPVTDAAKWHDDVSVYDVYMSDAKRGRIYLDLHPRDGKYKHAAQFTLKSGADGIQLPEGALVCNFPDPKQGPALMDHDAVVTLFHEFGHLMHHVLGGQQKWIYFSGVATEWDFVEAPSQMLEEWAWDPGVLALFAVHNETKAPIPAELVKKLRAANEFGKGKDVRQQMFYASLSLQYHQVSEPEKLDTTAKLVELQKKYGLFPHLEGTHFQANFGHLNGYSAMYYTYMWSLVIAKDLFSAFQRNGLLDEKTAQRYRDLILAPGGSQDAAALVKNFLGRDYNFKAFEKWLNQN